MEKWVVLVGNKTKCRKHIDCVKSGALNRKEGECYSDLLGLLLPKYPDLESDKFKCGLMSDRLVDNANSGCAVMREYTIDTRKLLVYIELAVNESFG